MTFAVELAYWQQTILRVIGVLVAVLLPAGTFVYVSMDPEQKIQIYRLDEKEGKLTAVEAIETQSIRCNHSALGYPAQNSIAA